MSGYGAPLHLTTGDLLGSSRLATTCLRALADMGRPLAARELMARLNPRPAGGDHHAWTARHALLQDAVEELADADLVRVSGAPAAAVLELNDRPDVRARISG